MPHLSVQWKGRPYRRFPRIRFASGSRRSIRTRSQAAAKDVTRSPLSSDLEKQRKKQKGRIKARHLLQQSSEGSSALTDCNRVSRRARHHIQVFGWKTETASKASTKNLNPKCSAKTTLITPKFALVYAAKSAIDSLDGATSQIVRRPPKPYSRTPSLSNPIVWSSIHYRSIPSVCHRGTSANTTRATQAWSSHSSAPNKIGLSTPSERQRRYNRAPSARHTQTSLHRIESRGVRKRISPPNSSSLQRQLPSFGHPRLAKTRSSITKSRRPSRGSQSFWEAVESLATKTSRGLAKKSSLESFVQALRGQCVTRTLSQQRKLKRFIKELEFYVQAAKSMPNQSLAVSSSTTTVSAFTVEALKPYHAEFQAAGLAVTSSEQRRLSSIGPRMQLYAPAAPAKDSKWSPKLPKAEGSKMNPGTQKKAEAQDLSTSVSSCTIVTDVVVFTPPQEISHPSSNVPLSQISPVFVSSQCNTPDPITTKKSVKVRSPAKKTLPWLRNSNGSSPSTNHQMRDSDPQSAEKSQHSNLSSPRMSTPPVIPKRSMSPRRVDLRPPEDKALDAKRISDFDKPERRKAAPRESHDKQRSKICNNKHHKFEGVHASTQTSFTELEASPIVTVESSIDENAVIDCYIATPRRRNTGAIRRTYEDYMHELTRKSSKRTLAPPSTVHQLSRQSFQKEPSSKSDVSRMHENSSGDPWHLEAITPTRSPPGVSTLSTPSASGIHPPTRQLSSRSSDQERLISPTNPPTPVRGSRHEVPIFKTIQCQQCSPAEDSVRPFSPAESSKRPESSRRWQGSFAIKDELEEACIRSDSAEVLQGDYLGFAPPPVKTNSRTKAKAKAAAALTTRNDKAGLGVEPVSASSTCRHSSSSAGRQQMANQRPSHSFSEISPPSNSSSISISPTSQLAPPAARQPPTNPTTTIIRDSAILRGLHVATAAACDEDVDLWIEEVMGSGVRKFLGNLGMFEGLRVNELSSKTRVKALRREEKLQGIEVDGVDIRTKTDLERNGKGKGRTGMVEERQTKNKAGGLRDPNLNRV